MVEYDHLGGHLGKFAQFACRRGDVHERDDRILTISESNGVFVTSRDEPRVAAPGAAYGPGSAESVGASGVIEAEFLQVVSISWFAALAIAIAETLAIVG